MKIVAGLGSIDEYIPYVKAGADEFFCGYVPYSWTEKYGTLLPLNRREVLCSNVQLGASWKLLISLYGVCPLDFKALLSLTRRCFYICASRG